ncbi:MAG: hypothetical protein ING75_07840 [Rhodocyclaceae bacterium]|nr:hypothetical protein [Rhodocyclaceae bacterium]
MQTDPSGIVWLSDSQQVSLHDLVELSGLKADEIGELVESGALEPIDSSHVPWTFSAECVVTVRRATRLRDELELDPHAVAVALSLLKQIRQLELEVARLQAQQSRI